MKKSTKIFIALAIILALVLGFIAGTQFSFKTPESSDLAGTIGKSRNIEQFKVLDDDPELLSKLLNDASLLKSHQKFFTYQLNTCTKLCEDLDFAIRESEAEPLFGGPNMALIEKLKSYKQTLEQSKADINLALNTLTDLSEIDQETLAGILKQASEAASKTSYKNPDIMAFIDSTEKFLLGSNPYLFPELIKAHDQLSVNNFIPSV